MNVSEKPATEKNLCYLHEPFNEEVLQTPAYLNTSITLKITSESDFGDYVFRLLDHKMEFHSFEFSIRQRQTSWRRNKIIGAATGSAVFVALILLLVFRVRLYLRVLYKRYFGPFHSDEGYDYDAFVSYHVSSKIDEAEQAVLREMVEKTRLMMERLGYKRIYDPIREGAGNPESMIPDIVKKSHRVFVFIPSNSYFGDERCHRIIQLSSSEDDGSSSTRCSKVVVIISKDMVKSVLKSTNEEKIVVSKSMKEGVRISWPSSSERKLRFCLLDAMPAFRKKDPRENSIETVDESLTTV